MPFDGHIERGQNQIFADRLEKLADYIDRNQPYLDMFNWTSCLAGHASRIQSFQEFKANDAGIPVYREHTGVMACLHYFGSIVCFIPHRGDRDDHDFYVARLRKRASDLRAGIADEVNDTGMSLDPYFEVEGVLPPHVIRNRNLFDEVQRILRSLVPA